MCQNIGGLVCFFVNLKIRKLNWNKKWFYIKIAINSFRKSQKNEMKKWSKKRTREVWTDVGVKSSPIISHKLPKKYPHQFNVKSDLFQISPKMLLNIWTIFAKSSVPKNFQKSPNLVTLLTRVTIFFPRRAWIWEISFSQIISFHCE